MLRRRHRRAPRCAPSCCFALLPCTFPPCSSGCGSLPTCSHPCCCPCHPCSPCSHPCTPCPPSPHPPWAANARPRGYWVGGCRRPISQGCMAQEHGRRARATKPAARPGGGGQWAEGFSLACRRGRGACSSLWRRVFQAPGLTLIWRWRSVGWRLLEPLSLCSGRVLQALGLPPSYPTRQPGPGLAYKPGQGLQGLARAWAGGGALGGGGQRAGGWRQPLAGHMREAVRGLRAGASLLQGTCARQSEGEGLAPASRRARARGAAPARGFRRGHSWPPPRQRCLGDERRGGHVHEGGEW